MKQLLFAGGISALLILTACGSSATPKTSPSPSSHTSQTATNTDSTPGSTTFEGESIETHQYLVNTGLSTLTWTGSKIVGDSHWGMISFGSGTFEVDMGSGELLKGSATVDMQSMESMDLTGGSAEKLLGHLKNEDFFDVENFPTSTIHVDVINPVADSDTVQVRSHLQIKDATLPVDFEATVEYVSDAQIELRADLSIDRTKWGIHYGSSLLGDAVISDEILYNVYLVLEKN